MEHTMLPKSFHSQGISFNFFLILQLYMQKYSYKSEYHQFCDHET